MALDQVGTMAMVLLGWQVLFYKTREASPGARPRSARHGVSREATNPLTHVFG